MKKIIIFLFYLFILQVAKAQKTDSVYTASLNEQYDSYMKKSKSLKTVGWIMLGSGLIIAGASYLSYANNGFNGVWENEELFILGGITAIASIPFFIASGKNKKKAKLELQTMRIFRQNHPTLGLRVNF